MTAIQILEKQVKKLKPNALAAFRDWFRKYDSDAWDRQFKKDARAGKLERYAREAQAAYKAGKTSEL